MASVTKEGPHLLLLVQKSSKPKLPLQGTYGLWQAQPLSLLAPSSDVDLLLGRVGRVLTSECGLWGKHPAGMGPGTGQPGGKSTPG